MSLSRKRKKELRKLQTQANSLWESQQVLVGEAATVAREASRQLGNFSREQVVPRVQAGTAGTPRRTSTRACSSPSRSSTTRSSRPPAPSSAPRCRCGMPPTTRARAAAGKASCCRTPPRTQEADKYGAQASQEARCQAGRPDPKQGIGAGGVIAIILGVAAALGVLYAAWQTLRADDELWVADDPLRAPDA